MKKTSIDNENWTRLVQEIQQAKDAFEIDNSQQVTDSVTSHGQSVPQEPTVSPAEAPAPAPAVATPAVAPTMNVQARSTSGSSATFARHKLADDMEEFLGSGAQSAEDRSRDERSGIRSHLGWGVGGFLLGAICWHLVGFWDFVGDVVLSGPQTTTVVERNVKPHVKPMVLGYEKRRTAGGSIESSKNCSAYYRDAETGLAHPSKCKSVVRSPGSVGMAAKR